MQRPTHFSNSVNLKFAYLFHVSPFKYRPLERMERALRIVQQAMSGATHEQGRLPSISIPRGDLQSTFVFKGFDEVRRLGLLPETEAEVRKAPCFSHGTTSTCTATAP